MDAPDLDADITARPIDDIIKDILRDLGLAALPGSRPWKRRTPADIAELNVRAAAPTSPCQPSPGPHDPRPGSVHPGPAPQHDQRGSAGQAEAATPCAQPGPTHARSVHRGPIHPSNAVPDNPAEVAVDDPAEPVAIASTHEPRMNARWPPPPSD